MGYNRYGWWNRLLGRSSVVGEDGWGSLCFVLFFFPGGRLTSVLWLFYCLLLHVVIITASVLKKRDGRKCVRMCFSTLDSDVAGVQSIPPSSSPAVKMLTDCYPLFFFYSTIVLTLSASPRAAVNLTRLLVLNKLPLWQSQCLHWKF